MGDPGREALLRKSPTIKMPVSPRGSSVLLSGLLADVRPSSQVDARTLSPVETSRSRERENALFGLTLVDVDASLSRGKKTYRRMGRSYGTLAADAPSRSKSDRPTHSPRLASHDEDPFSQSSPAICRQILPQVSSDSGTMSTCWSNMSTESLSSASMSGSPQAPTTPRPPPVSTAIPDASLDFCTSSSPLPPTSTAHSIRRKPKSVQEEVFAMLSLAWPASLAAFFWFSTSMVNTAMVGHINNTPPYLSAVTLSGIFTNVLGRSVAVGMCGGLATLGGQAFLSQNYVRVGSLLQRTVLVQLLLAVPVFVLWFWSGDILKLFGLNSEVCGLAGKYTAILFLGYLPSVFAEVLTNYLACQRVVLPVLPIGFLANVVNMLGGYFAIFYFRVGFFGAAWTSVFTSVGILVGFLMVVKLTELKTWTGWSEKAFSQWGPLLRVSGMSALLMCAEWYLFEFVGFAAGYVGPDGVESLAVWGVLWQIMMCVFMISLGLQVGMTSRISSELGAGEPEAARHSCLIGVGLALAMALLLTVFLIPFRHVIPIIWTRDEAVGKRVAELLPLVCIFEAGHLLQIVLGGAVLGLGRRNVGSLAKVIGYYIIGLPLALVLAFVVGLGVQGLLMGLCGATFTVCILFAAIILHTDWRLQSDVARYSDQDTFIPESESFGSESTTEHSHLLGRSTL